MSMKETVLSGVWDSGLAGTLIAFQILGFLLAGRVLLGNRSTQGTIAWAMSLLLLPVLAVPLYLIFGRNRLPAYVEARRQVDDQFDREHPAQTQHPDGHVADPVRATNKWNILESLAKHPLKDGNALNLHFDGQSTFDDIREGLQRAQSYILFQFFIFRDDALGRSVIEILKERAQAGVQVFFLVDAIGSRQLRRDLFQELMDSGIQTGIFQPGRNLRGRLRLNFRNHRKIVVVDGREAWIGGNNVGIEYLGQNPRFGSWRDTHAHLKGPTVNPIQLTFMEDWYWVTRKRLHLNWQAAEIQPQNTRALCLATGPADSDEACTLAYVHMINQARHRLWIHTPYFVPSEEVIVALQLAALRGVDVRVLLPGKFDKLLVWLSSYYFSSLKRLNGVQFYRYNTGFFHSKLLLVDDELISVGTVNFDNRSFHINFEITLIVEDLQLAETCHQQMLQDFHNATLDPIDPLEHKPLLFKIAARAARLLSPLL